MSPSSGRREPGYNPTMTRGDTAGEARQTYIAILRRMRAEARLAQALDLTDLARELLELGIAIRHPEYSPSEVCHAAVRVSLGKALFSQAYPGLPQLLP